MLKLANVIYFLALSSQLKAIWPQTRFTGFSSLFTLNHFILHITSHWFFHLEFLQTISFTSYLACNLTYEKPPCWVGSQCGVSCSGRRSQAPT